MKVEEKLQQLVTQNETWFESRLHRADMDGLWFKHVTMPSALSLAVSNSESSRLD